MKANFIGSCGRFMFDSGAIDKVADFREAVYLKGNAILILDETTRKCCARERILELSKKRNFKRVNTSTC